MSFNKHSLEDIVGSLRQSGHKVTPQRLSIIKAVMESTEHLTPLELYARVHRMHPDIGEVTVYRTLNILSQLGLVCTVHTAENSRSYIGRPAAHHDHLICAGCGRVVNFANCNLSRLEKRLAAETGFNIREHRLDFFGTCPDCGKAVVTGSPGESAVPSCR